MIAQEFSNSTNITAAALAAQHAADAHSAAVTDNAEWMKGFQLYVDNFFETDCGSHAQRRGYRAAMRAEGACAAADTPRYGDDWTDSQVRQDNAAAIRNSCMIGAW